MTQGSFNFLRVAILPGNYEKHGKNVEFESLGKKKTGKTWRLKNFKKNLKKKLKF